MREMQELSAEPRQGKGKGHAFRTPEKGSVPGIVYGGKEAPEPVTVDYRELERHASKGTFLTTPFMLKVAGKKTRVIPRALQTDPVSDRPVHVDFLRLPEGARVRLAIPVRFKGQENSPGLKRGGVLNIVRHEVELLCPAENIPEYIEGDLSGLDIHGSLHITDFQLPEGVVSDHPRTRFHRRVDRGADERDRRTACRRRGGCRRSGRSARRRRGRCRTGRRCCRTGCCARRRSGCCAGRSCAR